MLQELYNKKENYQKELREIEKEIAIEENKVVYTELENAINALSKIAQIYPYYDLDFEARCDECDNNSVFCYPIEDFISMLETFKSDIHNTNLHALKKTTLPQAN